MNAREQMEKAGKAPLQGWAIDGRKVNLHKTDVRKTWAKVRKLMEQQREKEAAK